MYDGNAPSIISAFAFTGQRGGRGGAVFGSPLQQLVVPVFCQMALHLLQAGSASAGLSLRRHAVFPPARCSRTNSSRYQSVTESLNIAMSSCLV